MNNQFTTAKIETSNKYYKSLFTLMANIANRAIHADQKIVAKLVSLCDKILNNIAENRAAET